MVNKLQKFSNLKNTAAQRGFTGAASAEDRSKGKDAKITSSDNGSSNGGGSVFNNKSNEPPSNPATDVSGFVYDENTKVSNGEPLLANFNQDYEITLPDVGGNKTDQMNRLDKNMRHIKYFMGLGEGHTAQFKADNGNNSIYNNHTIVREGNDLSPNMGYKFADPALNGEYTIWKSKNPDPMP